MNDNVVTPLRPKRTCPQCGKPASRDAYPFCTKRCSDLDLGNWLKGNYRIAAASKDNSDLSSSHLEDIDLPDESDER